MKIRVDDSGILLWLSARDTEMWADRLDNSWPCSELSGKRLFVAYDRNGICDLAINGKDGDVDNNELTAITSDYLVGRVSPNHPCWFVAVGQFQGSK